MAEHGGTGSEPRRSLRWSPTLKAYVRDDYPAVPPFDEWVVRVESRQPDERDEDSRFVLTDELVEKVARAIDPEPHNPIAEPYWTRRAVAALKAAGFRDPEADRAD